MARKSYPVARMLFRANKLLERSQVSFAEKKAICYMIETVLHDTGNYAGFGFIYPDGVETTEQIKEYAQSIHANSREEYLRSYYVAPKIREDYNMWKEKDGWKYE